MGERAVLKKQKFISVVIFATILSISNVVVRVTQNELQSPADVIPLTSGLDENFPALGVLLRGLDFASLGYIGRADRRKQFVASGRIGQDEAKRTDIIDEVLSFSSLAGIIGISVWISRKLV